jgi:hypothetical protein
MPKLDLFHDLVKRILIKDGWQITHDPFVLRIGKKRLFVDLGATSLLSAVKAKRLIAVEVKSFVGVSDILDLEQAVGQYVVYRKVLDKQEPERLLYLAITATAFSSVFKTELGQLLLADKTIRLLVFDQEAEVIQEWIPN